VATPIGHALAGYAVYRVSAYKREDRRTLLWLCLFLAIAPDFDFAPGILMGQPSLYHQGISHSLGLASVVSLILALVYGLNRGTVWAEWSWFFLAYASHLVIDLFGRDARPPYGIPLFWPIGAEHYLAPLQIFWGVRHAEVTSATTGEWITAILTLQNLRVIAIEVMVLLPVVLLVQYLQHFIGGHDDCL
jgi:inner membrane protein